MNRWRIASLAAALLAAASGATGADPGPARYLADGRLIPPADYRDWPFLTSGLDMSYQAVGMFMPGHLFDNVFVDPEALRAFRRTGAWPEGTVLVKESREGLTRGSINRSGRFQSESVMSLEFHVKDSARYPGGWAFFAGGASDPAQRIPAAAECYACHLKSGAVDTTFVQFYPTLVGIARAKATLRTDVR